MKIKHKIWFTQMNTPSTIGIIIVEDDQGEERAYLGTGTGEDQLVDAINIAEHGAKFPVELAKQVMGI
jgi:hypothetical protein